MAGLGEIPLLQGGDEVIVLTWGGRYPVFIKAKEVRDMEKSAWCNVKEKTRGKRLFGGILSHRVLHCFSETYRKRRKVCWKPA